MLVSDESNLAYYVAMDKVSSHNIAMGINEWSTMND